MDNTDSLLKQLGWSDELIKQVTELSNSIPQVRQPPFGTHQPNHNLTCTTTGVIYAFDANGTHNSQVVTV